MLATLLSRSSTRIGGVPPTRNFYARRHRMIRKATITDSQPIAKALWSIWQQFKAQQIPSPVRGYASSETLCSEISHDLNSWLVCELPHSQPLGFFSLCHVSEDKAYKRWGFPRQFVRIERFACLLPGEILLQQLQFLNSHLPGQSLLLVIPSSLRDAYWAATKAGFRQLGDCNLVVGAFVWLYLDRESKHDEIQTKLRKARVVA